MNSAEKIVRNSAIEMLRMVSMLMIVGFHWVVAGDNFWLNQEPMELSKFCYQFIIGGGGLDRQFHLFCDISMVFAGS